MKKFNLNGVNVELSKEKLQDMLKKYDEPVGEIKAGSNGDIELWESGSRKKHLLGPENEAHTFNLSAISRVIAGAMDDLMETKDVLSHRTDGYCIFYNAFIKQGESLSATYYTDSKHFKTKATANLVAKLLNNSQDMKDGIRRMSK